MSSTALLKHFETEVELTPVPGASHVHVIRSKAKSRPADEEPRMSEADWDKFEADINESFEQLP